MKKSSSSKSSNKSNSKSKKGKAVKTFKILNEKVSMTIDLQNQSIKGLAQIKVLPTKMIDKINLNSRACHISFVEINGIEAEFDLLELMVNLTPPDQSNLRELRTLGCYWKISQIASSRGELAIKIPKIIMEQMKTIQNYLLDVKIYYESADPKGGVFFVPLKSGEKEISYMYTECNYGGVRALFPCADNFADKTNFEVEVTTNSDYVVVASGKLSGKVVQNNEVTYVYKSEYPISPNMIFLAIGKFEILPDPVYPETITHFCMPGDLSLLKQSVKYFNDIYTFYQNFLGIDFPYKNYKQIFLGQLVQNKVHENSYESVSIFSRDMLYDKTHINQVYKLRKLMAISLAQQYYGCFVTASDYQHTWFTKGLSMKLSFEYIKKAFGNNEYVYDCYKMIKKLENLLTEEHQKPLLNYEVLHPVELSGDYYSYKSFFVIRTMEELVSSQAFYTVHKALTRPSSSKSNAYLKNRNWSTRNFLKLVKNLTGYDMKGVYERFIIGTNMIHVRCGFTYNEKDQNLEFVFLQDLTKSRFSGSIPVCIVERDGSHIHQFTFSSTFAYSFAELHVYSRVKKQRKRKNLETTVDENSQIVQPVEIACEDHPLAPLRYVKVDPNYLWFKKLTYIQPEWMWRKQLESDPSVTAQIEALYGISHFKNLSSTSTVENVLVDERIYYRVRQHAANALSILSCKETGWKGMHVLLDFYKDNFYINEKTLPLSNDFSDFSNYFVQCKVIKRLSVVKDEKGFTPNEILDLLTDLMKYNDNANNKYIDCVYLANIINSVQNIEVDMKTNNQLMFGILTQIKRYLQLDRVIPSYRNLISVGCISSLCSLVVKGYLNLSTFYFSSFLSPYNYLAVRLEGLRSMIRMHFHPRFKTSLEPQKIVHEIMAMIENPNENLVFKYKALTLLDGYLADKSNPFNKSVFQTEVPINKDLANRLWMFLNGWQLSEGKIVNCFVGGFNPKLRSLCYNIYKSIWGLLLPPPLTKTIHNDKNLLLAKEPTQEELARRIQENNINIFQKDSNEKRPEWSTMPTARTLRIKISKNNEDENHTLEPHSDLVIYKTLNEKGEVIEHPTLNLNKQPSVFEIQERPSKKKLAAKKRAAAKKAKKDGKGSPKPPKKNPPAKKKATTTTPKKKGVIDDEEEYIADDEEMDDDEMSPLQPFPEFNEFPSPQSNSNMGPPSPSPPVFNAPTPVKNNVNVDVPPPSLPKIKIKLKMPTKN